MNPELYRMQLLAGLITESEYKATLNENNLEDILKRYNVSSIDDLLKVDKFFEDVHYFKKALMDKDDNRKNPHPFPENPIINVGNMKEFHQKWGELFPSSVEFAEKFRDGHTKWFTSTIEYKKLMGTYREPGDIKSLKTIQFFIKRDNPNQSPPYQYLKPNSPYSPLPQFEKIYDFGGSESPLKGNNVIVVDIDDDKGDYIKNLITADLTKPQKLEPVDFINTKNFIDNLYSFKGVASNIDNSLKPGGILRMFESVEAMDSVLKSLKNFKMLELYTQGDIIYVALQK